MAEKIIKTKKLSESTAVVTEASPGAIGIEIGSGCIFLSVDDLYAFVRLLRKVDKHFLKKCDDGERLPGGFL